MEKRYQVFVSSTYDDLKAARSRVIQALLNINCIPCGMEYFPASDEAAWETIERLIPQCDYYIVIVAGKYGSIARGKAKSYTHLEYELAAKHRVPALGFLHQNTDDLKTQFTEKDPARRKKLESFRAQVARKLCKFWTSEEDLVGAVLTSLTQQMQRTQRIGWVRADKVASDDAKDEIIKLRKANEKLSAELAGYRKEQTDYESKLACGDDPVEFYAFWSIEREMAGKWQKVLLNATLKTTWNGLFAVLYERRGTKWSGLSVREVLDEEFSNAAGRKKLSKYGAWRILPDDYVEVESTTMVYTQFSALGLIKLRGSGWDISARGIELIGRILAIPKGPQRIDPPWWCEVDIVETVTAERDIEIVNLVV